MNLHSKIECTLYFQGDANIPAGKITLRIFLNKPLPLTAQDLSTFDFIEEAILRSQTSWSNESNNANGSQFDNGLRPFRLPEGCLYDRSPAEIPRFCRCIYLAEGQTARHGYMDPEFSTCLFFGFDNDNFAGLWMKLKKLSFFYRAVNFDGM